MLRSRHLPILEKDLFSSVIPYMEANYPVRKDADGRAIAGYSMGGGQALNIGLIHLDSIAWIGGFSSAPDTKTPEELVPNPAETAKKIKLLYISCGNRDGADIHQSAYAPIFEAKYCTAYMAGKHRRP